MKVSKVIKLVSLTLLFLFVTTIVTFAQNSTTILSWNIRDFGKTKSAGEINQITQIVRDYDIVLLQEVVAGHGGSQAVAKLADALNRTGSRWDYRISNPTQSPKYKTEKYAYLWKTNKAQLLDRPHLVKELENAVFREPYLAKFKIKGRELTLLNYHSRRYDENPEEEVFAIAQFLGRNASANWIVAGDFNLTANATAFNDFEAQGFSAILENQKTSLKRKCSTKANYLNHAIDNIFLNRNYFTVLDCGILDFILHCENLTEARLISDHVPVVMEIGDN